MPALIEPEVVLDGPAGMPCVLVFTEHLNATCVISFERPLRRLHSAGSHRAVIASQARVKSAGPYGWRRWLLRWRPEVVVFSRYAGPFGPEILADARRLGAAVVYHIDDDLLELPETLTRGVLQVHGAAAVVAARRTMMQAADIVYASTPHLGEVLRRRLPDRHVVAGQIYCEYAPLASAPVRAGPVVGYMGSRGHHHDLALAVPALERLLDERPDLQFEVFGSIAMPAALQRFGGRVRSQPVRPNYGEFLQALAGLGWAIGLAPLADEPFNRCKAPTKFIEYTAAGIPCIASRRPVYGEVVPGGAGQLVDDDWSRAIGRWLDAPAQAAQAVAAARVHCATAFAPALLDAQVVDVLQAARTHAPASGAAGRAFWSWAMRARMAR